MKESARFRKELDNWKEFREYQQSIQHLNRLETEMELDNTDARLINDLTRLSDWQDFEVFQQQIVVDLEDFEHRCRLRLSEIVEWEASAEHGEIDDEMKFAAHRAIYACFSQMGRCQEDLEAARKQLNWIRSQWPEVVAQVINSISRTPELQPTLEMKLRKQTHATFNAILKLGGRPSHIVSRPGPHLDHSHRLLHWSSETSKYTNELLGWRKFLKWRDDHQGVRCLTERQGDRYPTFQSALDFYANLKDFRKWEHDEALSWVKYWQRVVRWYEDENETPEPPGWLDDYAKEARSHMRDSEQKLADTATRLEKSMQEHAHALSQHGQPIGDETKTRSPQIRHLPTPPPSSSESSQSSRSSSSSLSSCSSSSTQSSEPSQPSRFLERISQNNTSSNKSSSARKGYRRSKKEAARKHGEKMVNTNTTQQALPPFSLAPHQVERDDDVEMMDAQEGQSPIEAMEELHTPESEDTVMTDFEDIPPCTPCSSNHPSKPDTNKKSEDLPSSSGPNRTTKKTRSAYATNLDQALSGKVPKKIGKQPSKKVVKFTEDQKMALLNAASTNDSPTDSPLLRRSERLKEKAVASVITSSSPMPLSHLDAAQASPTSEQKQPQEELVPIDSSRLSRPRKSKKELNVPEAPQTSRRKKSKISKPAIESSRSSKQKKLEEKVRDAARPS